MSLPLRSAPGPILTYLLALAETDHQQAADTANALRDVLSTSAGRFLLEVLEKAVVFGAFDPLSDERALAARNAPCLIAVDLKRMAENGDRLLEQRDTGARRRRRSSTDGGDAG